MGMISTGSVSTGSVSTRSADSARGDARWRAVCWALLAALLVAVLAAAPAGAQSDQRVLRSQIDDLKNQIITLRAQIADLEGVVYGGGAAPRQTGAGPATNGTSDRDRQRLAIAETRLDEVDEWKRSVAGRFEELANMIRRVEGRIDKLVADVDFRLSALEDEAARDTQTARADATAPTRDTGSAPSGATGNAVPSPETAAGAPGEAARVGADGASVAVDAGSGYEPSGAPRDLGTIPAGEGGSDVGGAESQLAALPSGPPEVQYDHAFDLLRRAQYDAADAAFAAFVAAHPEHALTENASYWRGESFYARRLFGDAARIYALNLQRYPDGAKAPDNMVKLGMSLVNLERFEDACRAFNQLDQDYPNMPSNIQQAAQRGRAAAGCL